VPLPTEQLYCPALSVTVFDCVFMGFSQPKLGNFTIPIGEIMHDRMARREFTLKHARSMGEKLQAVLDGRDPAEVVSEEVNDHAKAHNEEAKDEEGVSIAGGPAINGSDDGENGALIGAVDEDEIQMDFEDGASKPAGEEVEGEVARSKKAKANAKKINKAMGKQAATDLRDKHRQMQ